MSKPLNLLTQPIRVAVLGSGGREHALAKKLAESPYCASLIVLPGNDGMLRDHSIATRRKISLEAVKLADPQDVIAKLQKHKIELVVIGPDDLLAAGMTDALQAAGFAVFGPSKAAAQIESSKAFAKDIMGRAGVPTAKHALVGLEERAHFAKVAETLGGYPVVLKFDGLALGKGVRICENEAAAQEFLADVFDSQKFKRASSIAAPLVVAEQFLQGHEVSLFALTDSSAYALLAPACDHKRLLEGNIGPNTGGMGAYSPVPWLPDEPVRQMAEKIFPPVLAAMREARAPFKGLLYAGLMVRGHDFWVLEFNARFGDPETQAVLPRLTSDLLPLLYGVAVEAFERNLKANPLRWKPQACVNVVAASPGYPDKPQTGFPIEGQLSSDGVQLYFAGVKAGPAGLVTSGGRVLSVSALEDTFEEARETAVRALSQIRFEGMHFRKDIGRVRPGR